MIEPNDSEERKNIKECKLIFKQKLKLKQSFVKKRLFGCVKIRSPDCKVYIYTPNFFNRKYAKYLI